MILRRGGKLLVGVLFAAIFTLLMINVHEIGHTLVALALGDSSAHYVLVQKTATSTCGGCNLYDSSRLSDGANIVVNVGGVFFTQLLGWTAILLMAFGSRRIFPRWMLLTAIAITWLGDLIVQLLQGLAAPVPVRLPRGPEISYTDYTAVAWFARDMTGAAVSTWKLLLLLGTVAYSGLLAAAVVWAMRRQRRPLEHSAGQTPW